MFDRGIFTISLDFELAWGSFCSGRHEYWQAHALRHGAAPFARSREIIDRLLTVFDRFELPVTWATVGHLFLDHCDGKHADMPRSAHSFWPHDWYALDPGTDARQAPLWYGRDLVEKILSARVRHDIGSHSFSHCIFTECSREVAEAELRRSVELAAEFGLTLRSFVYPRNQVAHEDLLPRYGFRAVRAADPFWYLRTKLKPLKKLGHVLDDGLALPPPVGLPVRRQDGLWVIPTSMFLNSLEDARRLLPHELRVRKARLGIDAAVRQRRLFHLTFHPINLWVRTDEMFRTLVAILEEMARRRERGELATATMAELAGAAEPARGEDKRAG